MQNNFHFLEYTIYQFKTYLNTNKSALIDIHFQDSDPKRGHRALGLNTWYYFCVKFQDKNMHKLTHGNCILFIIKQVVKFYLCFSY